MDAEQAVLVMAKLTTRDVQNRLLTLDLGRMVVLAGVPGLDTFVSDKVVIGRTDRGFMIYVHERGLVKSIRSAFADASGQVTVEYIGRPSPLDD
jgi:hypothetical protein